MSHTQQTATPTHLLPPVEKLLDQKVRAGFWTTEITGHSEFSAQLQNQHDVLQAFRRVMSNLPTGVNLPNAVAAGQVKAQDAIALYQGLTEYIEREPGHERIVLFLPFALTAPMDASVVSPELAEASRRFQHAYRTAFEHQLMQHEVRANFTNGDVLESELRTSDHARVVKATHLIPGLIASGHLTETKVVTYADRSADALLKEGVQDALRVASQAKAGDTTEISSAQSIAEVITTLEAELSSITTLEPKFSTPARTAWLRKDARETAIRNYAQDIAVQLLKAQKLPSSRQLDPGMLTACVDAVRLASLKDTDVFQRSERWLAVVRLKRKTPELQDALQKLYAHLASVGVVSEDILATYGYHPPNLAGPLSENLVLIADFLTEVTVMNQAIRDDPFLVRRLYPVTLVFGSQLKGYGTTNADADVAVFVRPGTARIEREKLEQHLTKVFAHKKIGGKAVLFWLEKKGEYLQVIDWPDRTHSDGNSSWIHVLFGAAWVGDEPDVKELHQQLLTTYFFNPGTTLHELPTRNRWLEEMERDTVLYRLLHKGFERYFPVRSPYDTPAGQAIDGASAFYDPKFRRIASELYLGRVFLPRLTTSVAL